MHSLSSRGVVDQLTRELAERRNGRVVQRAAYLALARAILDDDQPQLSFSVAVQAQPTPIMQTALAA